MKKMEEVELFGKKLLISQRSIKDIIDASNFSRDNPDPEESLFVRCYIIHSALKINIDELPKPDEISFLYFIQRWKRKRAIKKMESLIDTKNIMKLTINEAVDLVDKITTLDYGKNGTSKKKEADLQTSK